MDGYSVGTYIMMMVFVIFMGLAALMGYADATGTPEVVALVLNSGRAWAKQPATLGQLITMACVLCTLMAPFLLRRG
jgi:hypothetical protein